jgi:hypothetical protein
MPVLLESVDDGLDTTSDRWVWKNLVKSVGDNRIPQNPLTTPSQSKYPIVRPPDDSLDLIVSASPCRHAIGITLESYFHGSSVNTDFTNSRISKKLVKNYWNGSRSLPATECVKGPQTLCTVSCPSMLFAILP